MEFLVRSLVLFLFVSAIDSFRQFWMGNLQKNIQLMLEFVKGPFFVLYFSYSTLITLLMILSVILLSMLMILLTALNVARHLTCGNNQNWLLNQNLIYKTLLTGAGSQQVHYFGPGNAVGRCHLERENQDPVFLLAILLLLMKH